MLSRQFTGSRTQAAIEEQLPSLILFQLIAPVRKLRHSTGQKVGLLGTLLLNVSSTFASFRKWFKWINKKSFLKNSHVPLYNQLVSYSLKRLLLNILFLLRQTESETAFVFLNLLTLQKGRSSSQPYIVVPYCLCCTEIVRIRTVRATELLQLVSHFTERERQLSCLVFPPLEQICLYHCFKCFQYSVALRRVGIHPSQCREC